MRLAQRFFRRAVLASFDAKCCIAGIGHAELLVASHIVPWKQSREHRANPRNGLWLSRLHDRAFDRGLITLDTDYRVIGSAFYEGCYLALAEYRPEDDLIEIAHTPRPLALESILQRIANDRQAPGLLLDFSDRLTHGTGIPSYDEFEMRIGESGHQGDYETCFMIQKPEVLSDGVMFVQETSPISVLPGYYRQAIEQWKPNRSGCK